MVREFVNPKASRSRLDRCLRRHDAANLRVLQQAQSGESAPTVKTFKTYVPGFVHVDIKYLPQMPEEAARSYLFVAIDRATRWVFSRIYKDQTERSSADFLRRLHRAAPMKITIILTDNASQFTAASRRAAKFFLVSISSTRPARTLISSIACVRRDIPKPMAWLSASMAVSPTSSSRPASPQRGSSNQP